MTRFPRSLLVVATLLCLAPWCGKAFDIDDPLFVWCAARTLRDPLDFYGGTVNWYGHAMPFAELVKNPPLNAFYLALVGLVAGLSETPLHLAMLIPAVATILGTYQLASRFCDRPALAALVTLAMPAFLVSSTSVMCDVPMVALWIWSLVLWVRGIEEDRIGTLIGASILMAACALTKYFGIAVVPLAIAYGAARQRKLGWWCACPLVPVALCGLFEVYLLAQYGTGAFSGAASYVVQAEGGRSLSPLGRGLLVMLFAGASLLPILFFTPLLWSGRFQGLLAAIAVGVGGSLAYQGAIWSDAIEPLPLRADGRIDWRLLLQAVLFVVVAVQLLALALADLVRSRDAAAVLLVLWVLGTLTFAGWINWSVNARSILPAAPAAAILLCRRLDLRSAEGAIAPRRARLAWGAIVVALAITQALCWVDYESANANRMAAGELAEQFQPGSSPRRLWFGGYWGFQYYLQRAGGIPLEFTESPIRHGDWIVIPDDNVAGIAAPPQWKLVATLEVPLPRWLTTTSQSQPTSFYSSLISPMPYRIVPMPNRKFRVYDPLAQFRVSQPPR